MSSRSTESFETGNFKVGDRVSMIAQDEPEAGSYPGVIVDPQEHIPDGYNAESWSLVVRMAEYIFANEGTVLWMLVDKGYDDGVSMPIYVLESELTKIG